jgi:hypothetical protein
MDPIDHHNNDENIIYSATSICNLTFDNKEKCTNQITSGFNALLRAAGLNGQTKIAFEIKDHICADPPPLKIL